MALSGSAKELKPLVDAIRKRGFKVVPSGKHQKVVDIEGKLGAKGKVVTDDNGPILISSTPGDFRARDMHVKRLKDRGVLLEDPWKPDKGQGVNARKSRLTDPEVQEKKKEALVEQSRRRTDRTRKLRERVEPIIVRIGGWDQPGRIAEFGRAAFWFLDSNHRVENWKTEVSALQNARQLKLGNTLSDKSVDAWSLFIDELERSWQRGSGEQANDEALRQRYFEIVRQSKGLAAKDNGAGPVGPLAPAPGVTRRVVEAPPAPVPSAVRVGDATPTVALRATYLMALGNSENMDEVMEVAERILRLEINALGGE